MSSIIGVNFDKNDSVHYFDPLDIKVEIGDKVICHHAGGIEIGEVIAPVADVADIDENVSISKVVRKATYYDISVEEINKKKEKEGVKIFDKLIAKYKLDMKLVSIHVMFDKSKMIFYFTSNKRIDFRKMVKDLAAHFRIRIELKQIGVRDEAKIVGGLGPCGRKLCCKSFLTNFDSISIKMARDQNLPLNPLKISGICGKLMCCIGYEYDTYREFIKKAPKKGTKVKTSYSNGVICGYEPLKDSVMVEYDSDTRMSVPLEDIEVIKKAKG